MFKLTELEDHMNTRDSGLNQGAVLMLIGSLAFIGYAVVFLFRNFAGSGFELGVGTLNGVTRDNLNALNPAVMHYIGHLHVATAGFIAATGIAVAALSWYGVRRGEWWAWVAAVVSPVVGLAVALPYHYTGPSRSIGSRTSARSMSRRSSSWWAHWWRCAR
jgi:hypothetical protein